MAICGCASCQAFIEIVCAECTRTVLVPFRKVRGRDQRFCSRTCANRWNARARKAKRVPVLRPFCACGCGLRIGKQATKYRSGHNPVTPPPPRRGPDHPQWTGGPKHLQVSTAHREWRALVFARDNWTCQRCGRRSQGPDRVSLNAHHIVHVSADPSRAFDVSNGVTLCVECHRDEHYGKSRRRKKRK